MCHAAHFPLRDIANRFHLLHRLIVSFGGVAQEANTGNLFLSVYGIDDPSRQTCADLFAGIACASVAFCCAGRLPSLRQSRRERSCVVGDSAARLSL
eukprot:316530-Prymnesium_polylepis.2